LGNILIDRSHNPLGPQPNRFFFLFFGFDLPLGIWSYISFTFARVEQIHHALHKAIAILTL